ncbi:hypothetical protein BJ170DRAFT_679900 [Xylariales sp. AK1849]|nr:hypothetical protein BJ170DRAFT_679900 [Xylariales sp. AK1849]
MAKIISDWEHVRKPRVERVKRWAKSSSERFIKQPTKRAKQVNEWHVKSLKDTKPDMNAKFDEAAFLKWSFLAGNIQGSSFAMDLIWTGYRRVPNRGDITLFKKLRPKILQLARRMYGQDRVGTVRYGKVKNTSYILIYLLKEPEGAEGHAADEFMALSANFYEVLKDGQAGEAEVINAGAPEVLENTGQYGRSLVELFEIQVNHPISGRLLVGPIEKQRRFMGI